MIELRGVKKSFRINNKQLPIVNVEEWRVGAGERVALLGPSGSGKSTVLHLLSGILKADEGEVAVAGRSLHRMGEAERDRFRSECIGYIMQDFHLIGSLTARQNVELVLNRSVRGAQRSQILRDWFERVGLSDRMDHLPGQLSRGQQQRVAIVRALITLPPVVLADEPTGSLDAETAAETMELLLKLCGDHKLTLVTVTHDLPLAEWFPMRIHMNEINGAAAPRSDGRTGEGGRQDEHSRVVMA